MLSQILGLANFILGRADRWRDKSREERMRVAAYLQSLSDCLARIAAELRTNHEPHAGCAELAHYARKLPDTVERELGENAAALLDNLRAAASSRAAAMNPKADLDFARQQMAVIEETAGSIKALAVSLAAE